MGDARAVACATWDLLAMELRRERTNGTEPLLAEVRGLGVATCPAPRKLSAVGPGAGERDGEPPAVDTLTVREQQVARLVAGGSTNRQIGQALGIAEKTTETHVHNIIRKLGAQNRAEVAARVAATATPLHGSPDTAPRRDGRITDLP